MNNDYAVRILEVTKKDNNECAAIKREKYFTAENNDEAIKATDKVLKTFNYLNAILYRVTQNDNKIKIAWWSDGKVEQA